MNMNRPGRNELGKVIGGGRNVAEKAKKFSNAPSGETALRLGKTALRNYPATAPVIGCAERVYRVGRWGYNNAVPVMVSALSGVAGMTATAFTEPGQKIVETASSYLSPVVLSYHSGIVPQYIQPASDFLTQAAVSDAALILYEGMVLAATTYYLTRKWQTGRRKKNTSK